MSNNCYFGSCLGNSIAKRASSGRRRLYIESLGPIRKIKECKGGLTLRLSEAIPVRTMEKAPFRHVCKRKVKSLQNQYGFIK